MIKQLDKSQTIAEERQKMSLDIHDGIIQSLYAIGLKMEALTKQEDLNKGRNIINNIREDLKEIAPVLLISEKTVRNYISMIYKKLHVANRTEAASIWIRRNGN